MIKLFVLLLFLIVSLKAGNIDFKLLREKEKSLVLDEFKKLYKERLHIHKNLKQLLKYSRSKKLQKQQLTFFQPKDSTETHAEMFAPMSYEKTHQIEASNVYAPVDIETQTTATADNATPNDMDSVTDETTGIIPTTPKDNENIEESTSQNIRGNIPNLWLKR